MKTPYTPNKPGNEVEPHKRLILEVARDIRAAWPNVYYAAKPYLQAMLTMTTMERDYGSDSAKSVIVYFSATPQRFEANRPGN